MADEIRVTVGVSINKDNLKYRPPAVTFRADMNGVAKGPSPGAITVTTDGTQVTFSELTTPGLCLVKNLDEDNYVEYGILDPVTRTFYPLGEILPGEQYVIRLSRNLREAYLPYSGTGTTGEVNSLYFKANTADCIIVVEGFES